MKDLIKDRLDKIENLEDRRLLKQILNRLFTSLTEYTEEELFQIKKQVLDEIENTNEQFDIYYQLLPKDEVDIISDFFFPVQKIDLQEMEESTDNQIELNQLMKKVYLNCDFLQINRFIQSLPGREFNGTIETTKQTYHVLFSVQEYKGYMEQIGHLYANFIENHFPWRTVLHPPLFKFVGVHMNQELLLDEDEKIKKIEIDLQEMDTYKKMDMVPLWNIKKLYIKNESFAVPAYDQIHFKHTINITEFGNQHGYIVDASQVDLSYVRKDKTSITIFSNTEKIMDWQIFQIIQPQTISEDLYQKSNHREDYYADRFAKRENFTIRSMCEISRMIQPFSLMNGFVLEKVTMKKKLPMTVETYDVNRFVTDSIREDEDRKVMLLSFKAEKVTSMTRDEMSFLVSEIQLSFPEFLCVGELMV